VRIRVFIVDDHAVLRAGLRMLLGAQADMEVCGEAASGAEAIAKAPQANPNIVTLDLSLPGGSGLKMIAKLRSACPQARVLVLTMHDDPAYLRAALAAGCSGYVVKTAADVELLTAIRAVHGGRTFVDMAVSEGNLLVSPLKKAGDAQTALSEREREVLQFLAQGHTNQAIADRLHLSVKTVETYRSRIGEKLGLKTRADLVRYALELGLLEQPGAAGDTLRP
jgi:two-component system, NarL family, response regulator NreC